MQILTEGRGDYMSKINREEKDDINTEKGSNI